MSTSIPSSEEAREVHGEVEEELQEELTPSSALKIAWKMWMTMLGIPFVIFMGLMLQLMGDSPAVNVEFGRVWFVVVLTWIGVGVPVAFFLRSRVFKSYWEGEVVAPKDYLKGMMTIWVTIEVAGILSLVGCWITNSLFPNVLPAVVAFILFTPFWPSGHAMTRPVGADDDAEIYRDPR